MQVRCKRAFSPPVDGDAAARLIFSRLMTGLSLDNIALERGERRIASGISARVAGGEALLLQGPNGSGKSTLLRVLAGLMPAAEGTVAWDGLDVARDREAHRARLTYLGHQDALKGGLTALENLQFWAEFQRRRVPMRRSRRSASRSSPTGRRASCRPGRSGGWP